MDTNDQGLSKLATGAKTGLLGAIGGRFLNVFGNILIARLLGPYIFGIYGIGWTLVRFFSLVVPLGMDRAVLRYAPKFWKQDSSGFKGLLTSVHKLSLGSGLLFGILFFLLSPWLAHSVYKQPELLTVFRLFSFAFPLLSLLIVSAAATRITQQIQYSVWLYDLGQPILGLTLIITFFLLGKGLNGVVVAEVLSLGCGAIIGIILLPKIFPEIRGITSRNDTNHKKLLAYSIPAMLGGAFSVYIIWLDRIFVGLFLSPVDNGIYTAVSQLSTIIMVILAGFSPITVPLFSHFHHQKNANQLQVIYTVSTKWGIYLCIPILAVLLVSPVDSLVTIYGKEYGFGANILVILLVGQIINMVTGSVNPLMIMTENQKVLFQISVYALIIDILLLVLLVPRFALAGAAISSSVSLSLLYLWELLWVKKNLHLWPFDRRYLKGLASGVGCIIAVMLVSQVNIINSTINIGVQALISLSVFIGLLLMLKLDPEDKEFLGRIGQRMGR
jgi:O-antigen/teichoic acid export membrane protein